MRTIELNVNKRDNSQSVRALRRLGILPAVVYGAGGANESLSLDARDFTKAGLSSAGAHLIKFSSEDRSINGGVALIKSMQTHPVQGTPTHVDFLRIDVNKPVEASITVHYTGKSVGVVNGGMVQPIRRELLVRALPTALPEDIEVDVTELDIHDSIHLQDIRLPAGVEAVDTENYTMVTVIPPVVEKAAEEEAGAVEAVAAEGDAEPEDAEGDGDKKASD